jgi:hypothetical protein
MRTVKLNIDEHKYEVFRDGLWGGENPEEELVERLKNHVRIHNEPRRPQLQIAGAKEPLKKENAPKNVISMGIAPRKTEVTLRIDDSLYGELEKMGRDTGFRTTDELIENEINICIDAIYDLDQPTQLSLWFVEQILGPQPRVKLIK